MTNSDSETLVALIGRTNVGKSTLFNRLIGKRSAIVSNIANTTRDWREGIAWIGDRRFKIIDTAGLEDPQDASFADKIKVKVADIIATADIILFIVDGRSGILPSERELGDMLRRKARGRVILVTNKAEGKNWFATLSEASELGLGDPLFISAEHDEGISELYRQLLTKTATASDNRQDNIITPATVSNGVDEPEQPLKIAIIGRPNVGKSTLINRLLNRERVITDANAGTTRDAISIEWQWQGRKLCLIDTAGLRKKRKVTDKLESLSVKETITAIELCHIVILLIDGSLGFEKQDLQITELVTNHARGLIIGANKWDLIINKKERLFELQHALTKLSSELATLNITPISGLCGDNLEDLMAGVFTVEENWQRRIPTGELNRWLAIMIANRPPPIVSARQLKLRYMTQVKTRPPTFVLFSSQATKIPQNYQRYLLNGLRRDFDFAGSTLRLIARKPNNPYMN